MDEVELYHPDLDRTIRASRSSVRVHERSGWQEISPSEEAENEYPAIRAEEEEEE